MTDPKDSIGHAGVQGTSSQSRSPDLGGSRARTGATEIEKDAAAAGDEAKRAMETGKQKAGELGQQAKKAASDAARDAKQQARSFVEGQKDEAANRVGGMAEALRSAAGSLDDQDQAMVADYARQAASGFDRMSEAISHRNLDDLVETVEDFARRQPVAFIGAAALAGFVMARFAKSSAERRRGDERHRYAASAQKHASDSDGYNPVGMAPDDRTSHRFPDASNRERS